MHLNEKLKDYTKDLSQHGLLRVRLCKTEEEPGLRFDSNDYLSLSRHEEIIHAYQEGYALFPSGSGGSMFLNGYHPSHQRLEEAFSSWLEVDACLLFSCGYAANLAVTALIGALKAKCLIDKRVHASIYDGLRLSQVDYSRFLHNDSEDASARIRKSNEPSVLITEGIFSMSGQMAPLKTLSQICSQNKLDLLVDEAHSIGLLGEGGRGAVNQQGLSQRQVPLRIIPLGKAFAGFGAIVAGQKVWIEALMQAGRSLIYSTAISPALSHGLLKSLEVVAAADLRRAKLQQLIQYLRAAIPKSPLAWMDSTTAIQQVHLGCPFLALHYAQELKKQGIFCSAIRQPTVTLKESGLRILLNYHHHPEHIDRLFQVLASIYERLS